MRCCHLVTKLPVGRAETWFNGLWLRERNSRGVMWISCTSGYRKGRNLPPSRKEKVSFWEWELELERRPSESVCSTNLKEDEMLFQLSDSSTEGGFWEAPFTLVFKPLWEVSKSVENDRRVQHPRFWLLLTVLSCNCGCQSGAPIPCLLGVPCSVIALPWPRPPASWNLAVHRGQSGPPSFWVKEEGCEMSWEPPLVPDMQTKLAEWKQAEN